MPSALVPNIAAATFRLRGLHVVVVISGDGRYECSVALDTDIIGLARGLPAFVIPEILHCGALLVFGVEGAGAVGASLAPRSFDRSFLTIPIGYRIGFEN